MHMLFPRDRERASPYYPSDRRFLDPISDRRSRRRRAAARRGGRRGARRAGAGVRRRGRDQNVSSTTPSGAPSEPRLKPGARPSPASAARAQAIRSSPTTTPSQDRAAKPCGASPPSRRLPMAKLARTGGSGPQDMRDGEPKAIDKAIERNRQSFEFALFCQWLADRQLGRAAERARERRPRDRLLSRSRGRRGAGRRGSLGARTRSSRAASPSARRPIRSPSRDRTGTCRRRIRSPARARAGPPSARSTAPTCATPACCASITRWALSACS